MLIKILVVDDQRDTLRRYTKAIKNRINASKTGSSEGATPRQILVEQADTISLALEKLQNESFEVLVVDLMIPGCSGSKDGRITTHN